MPETKPHILYRAGSFYAFALFAWVAVTLLAMYLVLDMSIQDTERNFQHETAEAVMDLRQKLQTNEAVLSGFAAFLHAVESGDREAATRYAGVAMSPYPHIYMLEAAREVSSADRRAFESEMQRSWEPDFTLRNFAYQGARRWQDVAAKPLYWPLVFLFPANNISVPLYGLDLDSVPLLSKPLAETWLRQGQSTSRIFRLFEGEPAYILFQAVPRAAPHRTSNAVGPFGGPLTALLVVKTSALQPHNLDPRDQVRAEYVLPETESNNGVSDIPPLFTQNAVPSGSFDQLLPSIKQSLTITVGVQTVRISFVRQLHWFDLSGFGLRLVAVISLLALTLVMLYLRRHYLAMQLVEQEHARAEFLAMHDPLTHLPNRHLLADRVHQAQMQWRRNGKMFALCLIDLDHFKEVNDTHGHEGGDHLLRTVAHRISRSLRATDTVARYGGDEFIVLIADVKGDAEARSVGEKLLAAVSEPVVFGEASLRVTCSVGIALCPRDGDDFERLCHQADHAMYKVKRSGRNGLYSDALAEIGEVAKPAESAVKTATS